MQSSCIIYRKNPPFKTHDGLLLAHDHDKIPSRWLHLEAVSCSVQLVWVAHFSSALLPSLLASLCPPDQVSHLAGSVVAVMKLQVLAHLAAQVHPLSFEPFDHRRFQEAGTSYSG